MIQCTNIRNDFISTIRVKVKNILRQKRDSIIDRDTGSASFSNAHDQFHSMSIGHLV